MTTLVYFDIETVPCQLPGIKEEFAAAVTAPATHKKPKTIAAWLAENRDSEAEAAYLKTSFDGGMGQVCCISLAVDDEAPVSYSVVDLSRGDEIDVLKDFYSHLTDIGRAVFVGHNIIGFDLPFLWKRSMVLGIKPPWSLPRNPKPWSEYTQDTMLLWDGQQRAGGSMDRICRLMGLPGKGDVSGADVWPMAQAGKFTEIATYCEDDVIRTRAMFKRMTFA